MAIGSQCHPERSRGIPLTWLENKIKTKEFAEVLERNSSASLARSSLTPVGMTSAKNYAKNNFSQQTI